MDTLGVVVVVVGNNVAALSMVGLEVSGKNSPRTSDAY